MKNKQIILIRHAEAAASWGTSNPDPGLSNIGKKQAKILRKHLTNVDGFKVISSPMARALQTCQIALDIPLKNIQINATFSEIPSSNINTEDKSLWLQKISQASVRNLPNNLQNWFERIIEALEHITEDTIIFSHFMVINAVISYITKQDKLVTTFPDYTSLTKIENADGSLKLTSFGTDKKTHINL